jgi:MFS family permease
MPRNIRLLYIHNFLSDFCPQWPFLVIYFQNITGSYTAAMAVMAVETLSAALFDIPTGIFSDRMGRRFTMACGSCSYALAISCYAFAHDTFALYGGALLWGLGQCLFSGNNNALLYESLKSVGLEKQYHHYRGSTGSMFQLALSLSAFLSMGLSSFGLRSIFMIAIIPQIIAVFVSLLFEEPRQHTREKPKGLAIFIRACLKTWRNPHLFWLVVSRAINYGTGEARFKFLSAFVAAVWPVWAVGLYRGVNHGVGFLGFRCAGRLIEYVGEAYILVARDIFWFIAQMIAVAINNLMSPFFFICSAFFFGLSEVASDHLMQKEFTDDERATMGSISSFATSIIFAATAVGIGLVSDQFGIRIALTLGICLTLLALPVNLYIFRKHFNF